MRRASKYNVSNNKEQRTYDGIVFDSAVEMKYYAEVILPGVKTGEIKSFNRQVKYTLQPGFRRNGKKILPIEYVADFVINYANGNTIVVDTKGCPDSVAKLKRKLFWYVLPDIDYRWICYSRIDGGFVDYETVEKGRKQRKKEKKEKQNGSK